MLDQNICGAQTRALECFSRESERKCVCFREVWMSVSVSSAFTRVWMSGLCDCVCVFYLKVVDSLSFIVVVSVIFGILAAQRSINQSFPSASYSHRLVDINAGLQPVSLPYYTEANTCILGIQSGVAFWTFTLYKSVCWSNEWITECWLFRTLPRWKTAWPPQRWALH